MGVGCSYQAFDAQGQLVSEKNSRLVRDAVEQLVTLCTDRANRDVVAEVEKELHAQYGHIELHHSHPSVADEFFVKDLHRQA